MKLTANKSFFVMNMAWCRCSTKATRWQSLN